MYKSTYFWLIFLSHIEHAKWFTCQALLNAWNTEKYKLSFILIEYTEVKKTKNNTMQTKSFNKIITSVFRLMWYLYKVSHCQVEDYANS